ncbi:Appr-1-p processing [Penicillium paradoxum]|uniref:Appr-1-p processing n=1 Tax=Penicillium paradoxum TaxID=176176 RepID=UPI002546F89A|nr:Appr-1-p processing [Penicillium paradoxum]KAJ5779989.1 Appr-1-p processing [Penicillium paradoxum]
MAGTRDDKVTAIGRTDSNDSIILMTSSESATMELIRESPGDLFDAPNGAALIHACNCQGLWGAGLARKFRDRYPAAYEIYRKHCLQGLEKPVTHLIPKLSDEESHPSLIVQQPLGTALIIPPQQSDFALHRRRHWIICLFASNHYGSRVDSEEMILNSTFAALRHMREQLQGSFYSSSQPDNDRPMGFYSSRFCTGLFNIPWECIRDLIVRVGVPINVYHPFEPNTRRARPLPLQRPAEARQN